MMESVGREGTWAVVAVTGLCLRAKGSFMRALCTFCLCSTMHACMVCAPAILLPGHVQQLHRMHMRAPACAQAAPALQSGTATPAPSPALP